jgi:hypothetical protein
MTMKAPRNVFPHSGNYPKSQGMKKTPVLFVAIMLCVTIRVHAQQIAGTDVRSTSLRTERSTDVTQDFSSCPGETELAPYLSSQDISRAFTCSADDDIAKKKRSFPASILSVDTPMTHCDSLLTIGYYEQQDALWEESYDTLRLFMEQCPFYVGGKYNSGVSASDMFTYIGSDVSQWQGGGSGRWTDLLTWLKQVLYLNPDTSWYCQDVTTMITALNTSNGGEAAVESAIEYVIQSGKCPGFDTVLLISAEKARHQAWLDSLQNAFVLKEDSVGMDGFSMWPDSIGADTLAHPFDTAVPSLQQVNLQILLGPQYASSVGASSPIGSQALLSAQLIANPVNDNEIDVSYQMGRTALVTMELRDVLGRSVPIANAKYQLEQPGDHNATLPAPNLPAGTYYLRITTDVGDAITLKVVKE